MPTRRTLLAAGAAALSTASAGCASILESSPPDPLLQDITIRNTDDEAHTVDFALDRDGERILDTTYELGPKNFEAGGPDNIAGIDGAWDSPRGAFTADVRVRDGRQMEFELDDPVDPATPTGTRFASRRAADWRGGSRNWRRRRRTRSFTFTALGSGLYQPRDHLRVWTQTPTGRTRESPRSER